MAQLNAIYRYPIKGFGPDRLNTAALKPGHLLPFDRAWAIENGSGAFDPAHPQHLKKSNFLMLARHAELASIRCRFDETEGHAFFDFEEGTIEIGLNAVDTHGALFDRLTGLLGDEARAPLRLVHAPGQAMTDIPQPHLSLINASTVRDLSDRIGFELAPLRFRGNLLVEGLDAWAERDWVGGEIQIGEATLRVDANIRRCSATGVNPATAERDRDVPAALFEHYGHMDCGVYLDVVEEGRINRGDPVRAIA